MQIQIFRKGKIPTAEFKNDEVRDIFALFYALR